MGVITTTSKGNTQSPFGSTVPSILGAFLNTLNTRAIDPTLSSQLQEANGRQNNKNLQRPSSPLPLLFTTLNDRGNINSKNINTNNVIQNNFKDNNSAKEHQSNIKSLKSSDSEYSSVESNSNDVYDYYDAAFENNDSKSNIKKRSYTAPLANAAISAA